MSAKVYFRPQRSTSRRSFVDIRGQRFGRVQSAFRFEILEILALLGFRWLSLAFSPCPPWLFVPRTLAFCGRTLAFLGFGAGFPWLFPRAFAQRRVCAVATAIRFTNPNSRPMIEHK